MDKVSIRRMMKRQREGMDASLREFLSHRIEEKVACRPEYCEARRVAFYYPWRGEVNLLGLAGRAVEGGKEILFPRVIGAELVFCPVSHLRELVPGYKGIPEPISPPIPIEEVDLFLVPGVAFDWDGYRLGMGGGYYDRALEKTGPHQVAFGVAYNFQLVDSLPRDWWDRGVDVVVTEGLVITPSTSWRLERRGS